MIFKYLYYEETHNKTERVKRAIKNRENSKKQRKIKRCLLKLIYGTVVLCVRWLLQWRPEHTNGICILMFLLKIYLEFLIEIFWFVFLFCFNQRLTIYQEYPVWFRLIFHNSVLMLGCILFILFAHLICFEMVAGV